jgi:molecular chaperone HscB
LLQLLGYPIDESSNTSLVGGDFLMLIMELREAVDEANSDAELRPLWKENEVRIDETCLGIGQAIDAGNLEQARKLTAQLQYWNRIDETIREKMDQLDED